MVPDMLDVLFDALRVAHMMSFALGIGAAAFLELQIVKRCRYQIDSDSLRLVLSGHQLITVAVITLWCTGLGLLVMRIGPMGGELTIKLLAKLAVVTLLTLNMRVIDRFVIPELFDVEGMALGDIPADTRAKLGAVAGLSGGCWLAALLIGGMSIAQEMTALELGIAVSSLLASSAVVGALAGALAFGATRRRERWIAGE